MALPPIPPPPRKPKGKPWGPWVNMTPEERSEYSKKLNAKNSGARNVNTRPGKPRHLTIAQWDVVQKEARITAKRIIKIMKEADQLPDDPKAVEALEKAVATLRTSSAPKDVVALGRLILDFTKAKPTARIEHTVKSAEDFLDELADEDAKDSQ